MNSSLWSKSFQRLYGLFLASRQKDLKNWFHDRGTKDGIEDPPHPFIVELEKDFQALDEAAWKSFVSKTAPYVVVTDECGWWTQLFECFNELKGYLCLKEKGYSDISFIKPKAGVRMPDLCGRRDNGWAWLEVKTLHETYDENAYLMGRGKYAGKEKDCREVEHRLTTNMKQRLTNTIESARGQLEQDHQDLPHPVTRKIIFLLVWFDSYAATKRGIEELEQFLNDARPQDIEIVHRVMNTIVH